MRPALLTSDVHLSPEHGRSVSLALTGLLDEVRGADVFLVGDIFDLSQTPPDQTPAQTLARTLAGHPEWVLACKRHMAGGGTLCFVPGNHDAELALAETTRALFAALEPPDDRQLSVSPWFCRRGSVHIEHGHVYDPDCAPNHPLSPADARSEGLGTALVRRYLAPSDALEFAHAHHLTPRSGLHLATKKWGAKTPVHVLGYFRAATGLCLESLTAEPTWAAARNAGTSALADHAERTGVPVTVLEALLSHVPRPTHHDFKQTFLRLYFDRIFAGASTVLGASLLVASTVLPTLLAPAAVATALGLPYLYASSTRSKRHAEGPVEALEAAAARIRTLTNCSLVVFGHTHVESERPGYVNLGSFAFAPGARPYLLLDAGGQAEVRRLAV